MRGRDAGRHARTRPDRLRTWLARATTARWTGWPRRPSGAPTPRALWPEVRSIVMLGVNYGPGRDPLAALGWRDRATISVYARAPRLSRRHQGQAQGARRLPRGARRRRRQGVRRHGAGDGEAARRGRRARLAGQAHRAGLARVRLLAVPRRDLHDRRAAGRRRRSPTIAAPAGAASTSARRTPSRRPTSSMRGAASPT